MKKNYFDLVMYTLINRETAYLIGTQLIALGLWIIYQGCVQLPGRAHMYAHRLPSGVLPGG